MVKSFQRAARDGEDLFETTVFSGASAAFDGGRDSAAGVFFVESVREGDFERTDFIEDVGWKEK